MQLKLIITFLLASTFLNTQSFNLDFLPCKEKALLCAVTAVSSIASWKALEYIVAANSKTEEELLQEAQEKKKIEITHEIKQAIRAIKRVKRTMLPDEFYDFSCATVKDFQEYIYVHQFAGTEFPEREYALYLEQAYACLEKELAAIEYYSKHYSEVTRSFKNLDALVTTMNTFKEWLKAHTALYKKLHAELLCKQAAFEGQKKLNEQYQQALIKKLHDENKLMVALQNATTAASNVGQKLSNIDYELSSIRSKLSSIESIVWGASTSICFRKL